MKSKKLLTILMCLTLSIGVLTACGNASQEETAAAETAEVTTEETDTADDAELETIDTAETKEATTEETETTDTAETEETGDETAAKTISDYVTGSWEGTVYTNETLGIKMTFPESYTIYTGDTLRSLMGLAVDTVTENSDIQNVNQETVTYDFLAMASDQTGNIILSVEENAQDLTAEEYVDALLMTYDITGVSYEIIQEKTTETIGDYEYCMIGLMNDYSEMTGIEGHVNVQAYMVCADSDFLYYFIVTFSDATTDELGEIMANIEAL